MEREPLWNRKSEELKNQEILTDRTASVGGRAIESAQISAYLYDSETLGIQEPNKDSLLNALLMSSPDWTISLDGKWILNPVDHKAEYRGL